MEAASDTALGGTTFLTLVQAAITWLIGSSAATFFALINSQQNLAYLPIMSVISPSQVNSYLAVIVELATFDPIPMEQIYAVIPIFDFQWTNLPS